MANAEAAISVATTYQDLDANPDFATDFPSLPVPVELIATHPILSRAPYTVMTSGEAVVTDGADTPDVFAFDLGSIATEVTAFVIKNNTSQELIVEVNGTATDWTMPPGAVLAYASPSGGATNPIAAIAVVATTLQVGDQSVSFQAFGDPE